MPKEGKTESNTTQSKEPEWPYLSNKSAHRFASRCMHEQQKLSNPVGGWWRVLIISIEQQRLEMDGHWRRGQNWSSSQQWPNPAQKEQILNTFNMLLLNETSILIEEIKSKYSFLKSEKFKSKLNLKNNLNFE